MVSTGLLQDPASELDDLSGLLGERDEHGRGHRTAGGVCPSQERLDADDPSVGGFDDRLVFDVQLAAVDRAGQYAYRDRKVKKRSFRALWIQRINAAVRAEGLTYGQFIHALNLAGVTLDRKVLADIAMHEAEAFNAIIAQAKSALEKKAA